MTKKVLVITIGQNEFITGGAGKQECRGGGKVYRCGSRKWGILQGDLYKGYPYGGLSAHPGRKSCTDRKAQGPGRFIRIS